MQRIFGSFAYGEGPRNGCWWDATIDLPQRPALSEQLDLDVAIVGAGFTGLSAALTLARTGARVAVFDAQHVGWGASGRNGGFCCLGGAKAGDAELDRRYGKDARLSYRRAELRAVQFVETLIAAHDIAVDRHSNGETELAHGAKPMVGLRRSVSAVVENYGVEPQLLEQSDLAAAGMNGVGFYGAMTTPIGFALNPRKYVAGLAAAAEQAGAGIFEQSPVSNLERKEGRWHVNVAGHPVRADQVIIATNGYSSDDMPSGLKARYLPTQSNVMVTRPLTQSELDAQGWFTDQMSFDSRKMVHYFRLMPDRRFLFGMRGGVFSSARAEAASRAATRRHFERMFPNWAHVETTHTWSGMVCLSRNKVPFVGAIPGAPGVWSAMCYHGNGVAMGSYSGTLVADLVAKGTAPDLPTLMAAPMRRFPFGGMRRVVVPPLYAGLMLSDL